MNAERINKLERNIRLKKKVYSKSVWKNYSFIPPSLVLFIGLLGLVYLFKIDNLLTFYSIPFVVVFILGTIWFKATKRYLINKKIEEGDIFLICLCIPLTDTGNNRVYMFSTGKNRNNKYYLEKEKKDLLEKYDIFDLFKRKNTTMKMDSSDIYLISKQPPKKFQFGKTGTDDNNNNWIVFAGENTIRYISKNELNRFS